MKMQFTKYCLVIIIIFLLKSTYAQTDMLFWFVAPELNDWHGGSSPYTDASYGHPTHFRFSNAESFDVTVTISQPADPTFTPIVVNLAANSTESIQFHRTTFDNVTSFDLDDIENYINSYGTFGTSPGNLGNKGLKIESTGRITAYYEVTAKWNMEIMALKGRNALGTEFYVPFQTNYGTDTRYELVYSAIDIVATEPNTQVSITPTEDMLLVLSSQQVWPAGATYTITLHEGETFSAVPYGNVGNNSPWHIDRTKDLAGTLVTATKPISVNTKDDLVRANGVDLVADQLVPVPILGNDYVVMKNVNLTNINEYAYALATDDNTEIFVDGVSQGTINAGEQMKILIDGNKHVSSPDSAFYVYHVSGVDYSTSGAQQGGAVLPSVTECTGSYRVSFVRSSNDNFYMNVMVRDGGQGGFELNGVPILDGAGDFTGPITTPSGDWYIASKSFTTGEVPVNVVQTLENTNDKLFHLGILNGYTDCFYGYFSDYNSINVQGNVGATINTDHFTCYGERVELVAYGANTYHWYANVSPDFLTNPDVQRPVIYPTANRKYTVVGYGDCNMKDSTDLNVYVADPIVADITFHGPEWPPCSPFEVMIENHSEDDFPVWRYKWWYGDGAGDTLFVGLDTLYHTYTNTSDTIQVLDFTLITENIAYCKDTLTTEVIVYPEIHADFTTDITEGCNPLTVNFTDGSYGDTAKYRWVFGDGEIDNTVGNISHTYSHVNPNNTVDYDVELQVTSPFFCRDTARTTISVYSYLESKFAVDTAEGCSPLDVTFTNSAVGHDSVSIKYGDGIEYNGADFYKETHTYVNTGDTVANFVMELHVFNDDGCIEIITDTIIVYPEFTADFTIDGNSLLGCNSRDVEFTNTTPQGLHIADRFLWTFGDGSNESTTNLTVPHTYTNSSSSDKLYTFSLRAESQYGCFDDTINQIRINKALANFTVDVNTACSPLPLNVTNVSVGDQIHTWNWDYGDGHTDGAEHPFSYTYNNTGFEVDTNKLVLEVIGTNGCTTKDSINIIVYPEVNVSYNIVESAVPSCDSLYVEFNSTLSHPSLPSITYQWDFDDGVSDTLANPTHIYKNHLSATPVPRNVSLHVETEYGCTYDTISQIIVNPMVRAKILFDKYQGCSPFTLDVEALEYIGNNSYDWDYGDGIGSNFIPDPLGYTYNLNQSYAMGGDDNYEVILTVEDALNNCIDRDTVDITVYSEVVADFDPKNVTDCNPYEVQFSDLSSGNTVNWHWDFGNGVESVIQNPKTIFENTTDATQPYNIRLTATSDRGCVDSTINQVSVYPFVEADFGIDKSSGCSPLTVTISNYGSGTEFYWYWDKDDLVVSPAVLAAADSTINVPTFTKEFFNNTGVSRTDSLTLIVRNVNGCYEIFKRAIEVHSSVTAGFTFNQPDPCPDSEVEFTDASIPAIAGYTYNWDFNDGSNLTTTSTTVNKIFENNSENDRNYFVTLEVETDKGCNSFYSENVMVYSNVIANFSIPSKASCPPFENAELVNTSYGNINNTYEWFVEGVSEVTYSNKTSFIRTYVNPDPVVKNYQVRLLATNTHGCSSEKIDTISVYERVRAEFNMDINEGCTPLLVNFDNQSQFTAATTYNWNFGDGATSSDFEPAVGHTFFNTFRDSDKPYTIELTLTSENYCTHDTSASINVFYQPLAKFFVDKTSSCPPLSSYLDKTETIGEDTWEWRFGDGTPVNNSDNILTHDYNSTGTGVVDNYELELWVSTASGCTDSVSLNMSVFPSVTADFAFDAAQYCSPVEVQFTDNSSPWVKNYQWRFDDGTNTNIKDPLNRFENNGSDDRTYNVFLRVASEYNCWDTITKPVTVYVQPLASFYVSPVLMKYPQKTVSLTNNTNFGPFDFLWEFGDINTSTSTLEEPGSFEYDHWGQKILELSVESQTNANCTSYYTDTVLITPPEINVIISTDIDGGCLNGGLDVEFTGSEPPYAAIGEVYNYEWNFGDGSPLQSGRIVNHTYTEAGVYNVQLIATSQEAGIEPAYEYKTIKVYANPKADFYVVQDIVSLDPNTLKARVRFNNLSDCSGLPDDCTYLWDFGDGNTSINRNTTVDHDYAPNPDDIPIKYDVTLFAETIEGGCRDSVTISQAVEIIGAGTIKFPNAFTPDGVGPSQNEIFKPIYEGVIEYELFIYNRWGELIFKTKDLDEGWNGLISGDIAKPDVYVWKAKGKFTNGQVFELAGDVTLIR